MFCEKTEWAIKAKHRLAMTNLFAQEGGILKPTPCPYAVASRCMRVEIAKHVEDVEGICFVDLVGSDYIDFFVHKARVSIPSPRDEITMVFGRPGYVTWEHRRFMRKTQVEGVYFFGAGQLFVELEHDTSSTKIRDVVVEAHKLGTRAEKEALLDALVKEGKMDARVVAYILDNEADLYLEMPKADNSVTK